MEKENPLVTKKDYLLISSIGLSFALFSIPIIKSIELSFISISASTVVYLIIFFVLLANFGLWLASIIAKKIPVILQVAKFGAVGAFNTFLDWGAVSLLIFSTGINEGGGYSLFVGIGFLVANFGSFFWNKYWTFSSKKGTFFQFFIVSIVGLGVKVGVASFLVNTLGPIGEFSQDQWAVMGNALGTIFFMLWNFIGYKFWVFKK